MSAKIGQGLFVRVAKAHAVAALVKQGYKRDRAEDLVERAVTGDEILTHAHQVGAFGDGAILGMLKRVIDWFGDPANRQKLEDIVAFILKMVALLAPLFAEKGE